MTETKYIPLKAGDVRNEGDEVRCLAPTQLLRGGYYGNCPISRTDLLANDADMKATWRQAELIGHPILASDLCHLEYRRRVVV